MEAIVEPGATIAAMGEGYLRRAGLTSSPTAQQLAGKFRSSALLAPPVFGLC